MLNFVLLPQIVLKREVKCEYARQNVMRMSTVKKVCRVTLHISGYRKFT